MNVKDLLEKRTVGSTGLSVGTHLALESVFYNQIDMFDPDREIPDKINIEKYDYHIFNIHTIIRNIVNAAGVSKGKDEILTSKLLFDHVYDEITMLESLYLDTKCGLVIFKPDYKSVYKNLNEGKKTGVTKQYIEHQLTSAAIKDLKFNKEVGVMEGSHKMPINGKTVLLTTNLPADLLNHKNSSKLDLLESHTGKLKTYKDWYSKYHPIGKKPLDVFPFYEELFYILGDKSIIRPMGVTIRKRLFDIAMDNSWTSRTSLEKVRTNLKKDKEIYSYVENYKKIY